MSRIWACVCQFCATSTRFWHLPSCSENGAGQFLRDVNAFRVPLHAFLLLVFVPFPLLSLICARCPSYGVGRPISPSSSPLLGSKLGQPGAIFYATSPRFWHFLSKLASKLLLVLPLALVLPRSIFCATSTHYHRIRVRIRDRKGGSEGPSWGLVGAIPGRSWHKYRYKYKYRYKHKYKYKYRYN